MDGTRGLQFIDTMPLLKDTFLMSGTAVFGLPNGYDAFHLVHKVSSLPDLPIIGSGTAVTWDEYITALKALEYDKDGDGIVDKPLCVKSTCLWLRQLYLYIASSLFQVTDSSQNPYFDPATFETLLRTPAQLEVMRYVHAYTVTSWQSCR